ncbi:MAG: tRNA pseudouridine(55) synthase TruB [Casimicrobiaceae bacterium]
MGERVATPVKARVVRHRVDGVLLLDKPVGLSSNAALQHAKRLFNAAKAGHTGTLDPLASGLLPLCFGEATKFAQDLLDARKEYLATVRFGIATTTGDAEGALVAEAPVEFALADLTAAAERFLGISQQVPPRYSALKYQGRNYYDYARAGVEIPRVPRAIEIERLEVLDFVPPLATLRVVCGKGTYIRTLAEDLAAAVGSVAHLTALRRTGSGFFHLERALTLQQLEVLDPKERLRQLLPIDAALLGLPAATLDAAASIALQQGRSVGCPPEGSGRMRAYTASGTFLGVVEARESHYHPLRLVRTDAASGAIHDQGEATPTASAE